MAFETWTSFPVPVSFLIWSSQPFSGIWLLSWIWARFAFLLFPFHCIVNNFQNRHINGQLLLCLSFSVSFHRLLHPFVVLNDCVYSLCIQLYYYIWKVLWPVAYRQLLIAYSHLEIKIGYLVLYCFVIYYFFVHGVTLFSLSLSLYTYYTKKINLSVIMCFRSLFTQFRVQLHTYPMCIWRTYKANIRQFSRCDSWFINSWFINESGGHINYIYIYRFRQNSEKRFYCVCVSSQVFHAKMKSHIEINNLIYIWLMTAVLSNNSTPSQAIPNFKRSFRYVISSGWIQPCTPNTVHSSWPHFCE